MLITVISALLIIAGILMIVYLKKKVKQDCCWDDDHVVFQFCSYGMIIFGAIFLLTCGGFIICNNCQLATSMYTSKYNQNVASLNATYMSLQNKDESYDLYTAIKSYNDSVAEFKTDIIQVKQWLNNPWTSWMAPNCYNNFDENVVSYMHI